MSRESLLQDSKATAPFYTQAKYQQFYRFNCPLAFGYKGNPSFDPVVAWHVCVLAYVDAYAIYDAAMLGGNPKDPLRLYSDDHPNLLLTDQNGNPLKIDWADPDGKYYQYAADISSPAWRAAMMALYQQVLVPVLDATGKALGTYAGFMIDDVNLQPSFRNSAGQSVPPPYGQPLWQAHLERYLEAIRAEFPKQTIAHNAVWRALSDRQIAAADYVNIQGGFTWAFATSAADSAALIQVVQHIGQLGRKAILEEPSIANASTFLPLFDQVCPAGTGLLIAVDDMTPANWAV